MDDREQRDGSVSEQEEDNEEVFLRGGDRRDGSLAHMEDDELRDGSVSEQEVCFLQDVARVKRALQRLHTKLGRPGVEEMSQVLKRGGSSSCQLRRHDECIVASALRTWNSNSRGQQLVDKC